MKVRLGRRVFDENDLVAMARMDADPDPEAVTPAVDQAVAAGAEILDLGHGSALRARHAAELVAAVRSRQPGLVIGVTTRHRGVAEAAADAGADLLDTGSGHAPRWLAEVAADARIGLVAASPERAERAVRLGVRADGILVGAAPGPDAGSGVAIARLPELVATGWPVLVELPGDGRDHPAGTVDAVTTAALCAWLGARVFATRRVPQTRQALDMVASIRGTREPALSRRGLV
ncbi:MAG: dihydropteroate synthase [Streptosporangiales bacterium]|nr:dihydropteroate synthase [Streptosporangiales bacterium]